MAPTRPRPRRQWVLLAVAAAAMFGAGLLVGGLSGDDGEGAAAPSAGSAGSSATSSASAAPSGSGASSAPATAADVAAACARAGEGAQEALDAIDEAGDAVADLDAQRLDALVDGLRPLRLSLPGDVAACRAAALPAAG